jgi:clan AA aspartic protease (TIGR02281 family)
MNTLTKLLATSIVSCFSLLLYAQADYYDCLNLYREGDYVEAIICLSKYINKNPKDVDALNIRAKCYKYVDDYTQAFSDINEAIKSYDKKAKSNKDALYAQRGRFYADIENYDAALKDYATAFKINPKNTDVLFERANLYYNLENYFASDADWKQILKIENDNIYAMIGLARNMTAKGQIDEAIKELDRLGKIDVRNSQIYEYRAKAYAEKEDYRKAIDDIINCIYYDELDRFNLAYLSRYAEHEFTYALAKVSEKVVTDTENKIDWLYIRTSLYERHEMYKEAIVDYNTIENLSPSPQIYIYTRRGICYNEIGEYDKAIAEFDKGLELQEHESLYLYKADTERLKGDYESSIADFTKAIELDPMNGYAYYKRGWTKEFKKDFQGALSDYTTAIEIDKDYVYTYVTRGRLYQKELNQPELAEKDFQTILILENHIQKNGNCRQYALFHLERIDEAITYQDSILSKHPTSGNYYDAVCLYSLMNRPIDAIRYLRIAFEKGYRDFIHMERDTDLDNIRNIPEFIELLKEWKNKIENISKETGQITQQVEIKKYVVKTKPLKSGIYEIPCTINDLPLKFIFDTGASDITISSLDAAFMLKNHYLNEYDFKDKRNYRTASGDIVEGTIIRLRKIKIGELELNNIEASVVHKQNAPLLFGQSALGKFVNITIDHAKSEIIFEYQYQK